MFKTIAATIPRDNDFSDRCIRLGLYQRILKGTIYDFLEYDFNTEKNKSDEYVPIRQRRPSVKYRLAKVVVDDSVSMLFSEGHFPDIDCADDKTISEALNLIAKKNRLNEVMINAATIGSIGSVAILMRVLDSKLFFKPMATIFLTPTFQETNPEQLAKVVERYKVKGNDLIDAGYPISTEDSSTDFWFMREWDAENENFYTPWKTTEEKDFQPQLDMNRSVNHSLGFVPIVWIKNLPSDDDIDGDCTFEAAIDNSIEIDYQLSQVGRGLKYSSDPTLMIKEPGVGDRGEMIKGGGNAIVVGEGGDAKLLEINGSAASAVIEYVRHLRELSLESIHGNRANADKLSAAQSGRSQELMNQALVWLADRLRITYGEFGLQALLRMIVMASQKYKLDVDGQIIEKMNPIANITLRWPAWYSATAQDRMNTATTLKTLSDAGHISQETAVKTISADYDIEDVNKELVAIKSDQQELEKTLQPQVKEVINA